MAAAAEAEADAEAAEAARLQSHQLLEWGAGAQEAAVDRARSSRLPQRQQQLRDLGLGFVALPGLAALQALVLLHGCQVNIRPRAQQLWAEEEVQLEPPQRQRPGTK